MDILELDLPTSWLSALINGDTSGLSDDDEKALGAFTADMVRDYGQCWALSCGDSDSGDFRRYHDASQYGVLACNVETVSFDITNRAQGYYNSKE